jgi:hypothetical protein
MIFNHNMRSKEMDGISKWKIVNKIEKYYKIN